MKQETFKVRFNTYATTDQNCWRIIDSKGNETLVEKIVIQVNCSTTKDWIKEAQEYKYHISCIGMLKVVDNCALIY
jgi:hypothetical protein